MYSTPYAHLAARAATVSYANSARPDAPVVAHRSRRRPAIAPVRTVAADILRRLADAVAPRPAARCGPSVSVR